MCVVPNSTQTINSKPIIKVLIKGVYMRMRNSQLTPQITCKLTISQQMYNSFLMPFAHRKNLITIQNIINSNSINVTLENSKLRISNSLSKLKKKQFYYVFNKLMV